MLCLRDYQKRTLDKLDAYFAAVAEHGAKAAFIIQTERPYRSVPSLPDLPYVCLRVPTGGGKTLMACHALGLAAWTLLHAERALCLWLVPSNAILDQTLVALRDRQHPYRQAVEASVAGQVRVMDLAEALYVQRSTLDGETAIIVSTLAALRVEDTDGRKVYEPAGALSHHFTGLLPGLEAVLEKSEGGTVLHSLANALRLRRPVVIMDEAHNARTPLSFETLARFNPSCVIEFTATPETTHLPEQEHFASNVLCQVTAAELKVEEMVKLPIKLRTHTDWKEILAETLQAQRSLEEAAREEERLTGEYLRPIALIQAQPRSQARPTLTVEVVKKSLVEDFKVSEDRIAIATGQTHELDNVNVFERTCPVRFIITVAALKEGWDCSFAYILCSVAEIGTTRAVEQILGRVLRLPHAHRKQRPELNYAYAFATSPRFIEAATALKDALVENGFQKLEADELVTPDNDQTSIFRDGILYPRASQPVTEAPNLSGLSRSLRACVSYDESTKALTISGNVSSEEAQDLRNCFSQPIDQTTVDQLLLRVRGYAEPPACASERRPPIRVPLLAIRVGSQLELLEETHLDVAWNLAECDTTLPEAEFTTQQATGSVGLIDVSDEGRVELRQFVEQLHEQLTMLVTETGWTVTTLASWLDRQIPHQDIPQSQSSLFIHKVVSGLVESRGLSIDRMARQKFRLRNAIEQKIAAHRAEQAKRAYQTLMFGPSPASLEVSPDLCLTFEEDRYAPNWYYEGPYQFRKHYYLHAGELRSEGEEFECAVLLDELQEVATWVRNLERRPDFSFWLITATDRFYPDFVARLTDGRILIVEYKGEDRWSNDDSKEKRAVGELWAARSGGRCLFVMPKGKDWNAIRSILRR
jgi:type III restriction enzyme